MDILDFTRLAMKIIKKTPAYHCFNLIEADPVNWGGPTIKKKTHEDATFFWAGTLLP